MVSLSGRYHKIIWLYQCKLASEKDSKANISSVNPSSIRSVPNKWINFLQFLLLEFEGVTKHVTLENIEGFGETKLTFSLSLFTMQPLCLHSQVFSDTLAARGPVPMRSKEGKFPSGKIKDFHSCS